MINKSCLACDCFRDDCVGKDGTCGSFRSIDFERASPGLHVPEKVPVLKWTPPSSGTETRRQKFDRIGKKRQQQALEAIRKLEHLTSRYHRTRTDVTVYTYEWTAQEALELVKPITEALANLQAELIACDIPYEHGMIEETK